MRQQEGVPRGTRGSLRGTCNHLHSFCLGDLCKHLTEADIFVVFMIGDFVRVITRRYREARRQLEFWSFRLNDFGTAALVWRAVYSEQESTAARPQLLGHLHDMILVRLASELDPPIKGTTLSVSAA